MNCWLEVLRRNRLMALGVVLAVLLASWMLWSLFTVRTDAFMEAIRQRGYPVSLAELDAWYPAVPPAENAALVYTNAFALLTNSSGLITNFMGKDWPPPIGQGLSAEDRSQLKAVLAANQATLRILYSAPASGRSRYPIRLADGWDTRLPHLAKTKEAVSLLSAEALLRATDDDADQATQAFLAAGRLAASLSEEPLVISQLVRYADWGILLAHLERALSLTRFTEGQLASLQKLIEAGERPGAAVRALAAEEVCGLSVFANPEAMAAAFTQGAAAVRQDQNSSRMGFLPAAGVSLYRFSGLLKRDEAFYCDTMGKHLAALELSYPARFAAAQQVAAITNTPNRWYIFSRMLLPALGRVHVREADHVALVRVAATALALERFRLAHTNALPDKLEQLTPAWCRALATDPIDGKPLRYKTHGTSYTVYGIGGDAQDEGGVVWESNYVKVPQDVSFVVKH
jgi:hypothetical protein